MAIKKFSDGLNKAVEAVGMVVLIVLIIATSLQVITRYIFNDSLTWTDELARYCFIWASMLGAAVACYRGANAAVDVFVQNFKGKVKIVHKTIVHLIIIYIAVILTIKGVQAVQMVQAQTSTAMHIPMSAVYAALPVNMIIIAIQSVCSILGLYLNPEPEE